MKEAVRLASAPPPEADDAARILVVDDDEGNLVALESTLADLGHPVVCARSGEEALREVLRHDFAVILLDVRMPGMDGYETAELIRARVRSRHIPIIFLSGVDKDPAHLFRGYAAGAVDYVFKPVEPVVLRSKVAVFADLHDKAREIRRHAEHEKRLMAENLEVRRRQMEVAEALEQSRMQQSLVIDTLPIVLFVASPEDRYLRRRFVGGSMQGLCGLTEADLAAGTSWLDHLHDADRDRLAAAIDAAADTGSLEIEYRLRCGDGSCRWIFERAGLRAVDGGGRPEMFGILTDISERKRLEEQLTHAQKMEAIGQMSGGIAHDFNNMLSVIIGSLARVLETDDLDARSRRRLDLAMQASQSCADLTKQLLGFARRQSLDPRALDIGAEIERLHGLFERVLGENVAARVACPPDLWPVHLDPSQFEAAMVNLAVNARDAMPDGGSLTIAGANVAIDSGTAAGLGLEPGDYVRLAVSDTGCGMDAATQSRALEPFFTTKAPGEGTGLGLSSIYGFMRQSGGGLAIESAPGQGATIALYLPRDTAPSAAAEDARPASAPSRFDGLRVLVVEDNEQVREIAVFMLEGLGCDVVPAASGDAAAAMLDELGDISVLFTDCVMPGEIDGAQLAKIMSERHGELAIVFTSGYRGPGGPLPKHRTAFLRKPYTTEDLASALAATLGT